MFIFFLLDHTFNLKLKVEGERSSNDVDGQNFENLKYDPSKSIRNTLLDNSCDADLNFYNINIKNINMPLIMYLKISILFWMILQVKASQFYP